MNWKKITIFVLILLSLNLLYSKDKKTEKWNDEQKFSYMIGAQTGTSIKGYADRNKLKIDMKLFIKGLQESFAEKKVAYTQAEMEEFMKDFQQKLSEKQQKETAAAADVNLKKGKDFLEKNKKNKNVKVTDSGLQYKVLKSGSAKKPKATDTVKVHYKGTTIDGKEFDSSYKRNRPAEFKLTGVIKGWTEGVQLMGVGAKYTFYIPSELAYGLNAPPSIGPNQVLIFDIELLEVK